MEVASRLLSNQHNPLTFTTMQQECDEEFEEITDKLSHVILTTAILDIDEMLLEQQWKRLPGNGSSWEQALVKHKIELQQGLAGIKERLRRAREEEAIAVDIKEITSIIVQEPDPEDDRKVADALEGGASSPQGNQVEPPKAQQTPSITSPQLQETPQDSNSSILSSTLIGLTPSPAPNSLLPSTPSADTTEEFASLMKDLLEPGTDDEQPNPTRVETKLQKEESTIEVTVVEKSTRIINPNANMANETSTTQSVVLGMAESTERSSIEVARGHKRDSDEAGLDERTTSNQIDLAEQDTEVETPPKKLKDTGESEMLEIAPPKLLPKTPAKGTTLCANMKANPASLRRSKRHC